MAAKLANIQIRFYVKLFIYMVNWLSRVYISMHITLFWNFDIEHQTMNRCDVCKSRPLEVKGAEREGAQRSNADRGPA